MRPLASLRGVRVRLGVAAALLGVLLAVLAGGFAGGLPGGVSAAGAHLSPADNSPTTPTTTTSSSTTPSTTTPSATTPEPGAGGYVATAPTKGALASDGQEGRYLLGGTWLQKPDPTDTGLASGWWRNVADTTGWTPTTIPNAYNAGNYSTASMNGSVEWYRRDFTLPLGVFAKGAPRTAQSWMVEFESVGYGATVWINGVELGTHTGAYLPFEFRLSHLHGGVNRLVVRVDDRRTAASLPPGPGGGWFNFGGILDVVYLRPISRADLDSVTIRSAQPCPTCAATITEQATVVNTTSSPQKLALRGQYGAARLTFGTTTLGPGATWSPTATATIAHPQLWAPGSPNLYHATVTLSDAQGRFLGGYSYESGIRTIAVTPDGRLELNGRLLSLRGVNLHEQTVSSGAALSVAQQAQLIAWVRALGATIIRAHYPLDPEMEQMADEDGILLWSEVPVYQVSDTYLGQPAWRTQALGVLAANITANQNHPSILLWSIGNELPTPPTANETAYIAAAAAEARQMDPTRPVGMAVSNWPGVACQTAYAPLQVIGINEYFGWFDAGGGTTDDRNELSPYLDSLRACYPKQALMITEFGYGANRSGPVEVRGTYQYQLNMLAFTLGVFASKSWLSGAIYFPMQDFAASPGYDGSDPRGTPPWVDKGVLDQFGNAKPSFALMAQLYQAVQQIAPPS